jgi:hypothetical protein
VFFSIIIEKLLFSIDLLVKCLSSSWKNYHQQTTIEGSMGGRNNNQTSLPDLLFRPFVVSDSVCVRQQRSATEIDDYDL